MIEAALGDRDQRALERKTLRHEHQRFQPLVERQLLPRRRHRKSLAARARKTLRKIETQHLVDALDPDVDKGSIERDRFRIEPAARGERPAVGPQPRRGPDVVEPGHLAPLIEDAPGEPGPVIAEGNKTLAFGIQPQSRQSAKTWKG